VSIGLRARAEIVPEGMARRVIRLAEPGPAEAGPSVVTLAVFPAGEGEVLAVASTLRPAGEAALPQTERQLERAVRSLMPFAGERLRRSESPARPHWDDDGAFEDPVAAGGWPGDTELRVSSRPRIYRLPREELGVLGIEGDCLLGWRGGDVIGAELA
jgi:hypothetical protein